MDYGPIHKCTLVVGNLALPTTNCRVRRPAEKGNGIYRGAKERGYWIRWGRWPPLCPSKGAAPPLLAPFFEGEPMTHAIICSERIPVDDV